MKTVDWSKAPDDAQFYSSGTFRKHENGDEYEWNYEWIKCPFDPLEWHRNELEDFEVRPELPDWNGKGLPPVGAIVEYAVNDDHGADAYAWRTGDRLEVLANKKTDRGTDLVVLWNLSRLNACSRLIQDGGATLLKPIKSDKDKWIDAVVEFTGAPKAWTQALNSIYDAMKSGKLPKVEG